MKWDEESKRIFGQFTRDVGWTTLDDHQCHRVALVMKAVQICNTTFTMTDPCEACNYRLSDMHL